MKKLILLAPLAMLVAACGVNPQGAAKAIEAQGMTEVKIGGWSFIGCSRDDGFKSSFTAKGANGQKVSGTVCSGVFTGYTVRYD